MTAHFITDDDRERIREAVVAAERRTSGEFVTVVARAADDYTYIPLLWAAGVAMVLPGVLWWFTPLPTHALLIAEAAVFIVLALVLQVPVLRRRVIPAAVARRRATLLARAQFLAQGLHRTRERTGVLLFVSVEERYVEILADEGINARVPPGAWQGIVDAFIARVRAGDIAGGFVAAVQSCGDLLAEHFPRAADDVDELPNRLVELD